MELGLKGKRALIMGASRGLGFGIAEQLKAEGAQVIICSRTEQSLQQALEKLLQIAAGSASYIVADLSDSESIDALAEQLHSQYGGIDILVNNSGGPPPGPISAVDTDMWQQQFATMATSIFRITGHFLPGMRQRGWGRILNLASSGVLQPIPVLGISNTIRASIIGWAKTLSLEVASDGVTVNTLLPGRIATDRLQQLNQAAAKKQQKTVEQIVTASLAEIPMGRFGEVEEFAKVATFLVSDCASYMTGGLIRADGGAIKAI